MLMKQPLGVFLRRALTDGDHLTGHQVPDLLVQVAGETDIAVGQDADETVRRLALAIDHGNATDLVCLHQFQRLAKRALGRDGERVHHHAGFIFFHAADFGGLRFDAHILVDDPDAAGLGHGDGEPVFGHRVHRR